MNEQTLVAVYDTAAHASAAVADLHTAHIPADAISQHAREGISAAHAPAHEEGFWHRLFGGGDTSDAQAYDRSYAEGATIVTVKVGGEHADRISEILEKHNPVDLDERGAAYTSDVTTTTRTTDPVMTRPATLSASSNAGTLQLAEERLSVGKRAVSGGTTRIRRFVVETPVSEQVTLHSEKVTLDRRPVTDGRPVTASFADKTIEMTETSEEAIIAKTAHVTEEISLKREASDRVEIVKDTVRRDEVEIEHVPGGKPQPVLHGEKV